MQTIYKNLDLEDRLELGYAQRAVSYLIEKRKELNEELKRERRIVRRLEKKNLESEETHAELVESLRPTELQTETIN